MPIERLFRLTRQDAEAIKSAELYIRQHFNEKISAEQLSQEFIVPLKQLHHGIKVMTGHSVHNYILKLRMEKAKELLTDTEEAIQNIPKKIGLTNSSHFSRAFKKYVGKTPIEYRLSSAN